MESLKAHYSVKDIETRILNALREAGLDPDKGLSPQELGALDHFHTGGFAASLVLQELAKIQCGDRVLDIGAGLAGPARMLASSPGCHVDCIELSEDYCVGAELLNKLTGLEDRIQMHRGSALELPFPDNSFDAAWMQNVGMNIENKQKLYEEVCRVLKPGGCFAFQEMTAGDSAASYFPLPWATDPVDNLLISAEEMQSLLNGTGFIADYFEDVSDTQLNPPSGSPAQSNPQVQLSLSAYVDNLGQKAENATRSLREGEIRFVRGVFRVK